MKLFKWAAISISLVASGFLVSFSILAQELLQVQLKNIELSNNSSAKNLQELPPLIDRNLFFADPQIANAKLSPDGEWLAFEQPKNNVMNIWVKRFDEPFEAARPITNETNNPIAAYNWSADGRYIIYLQDQFGDENYHLYAVDPTASPEPGEEIPSARNLTPFENIQAQIIEVPIESPNFIVVGLNDRDPRFHDVYQINLETGERQLVFQNDYAVADWLADRKGKLRLGVRETSDGGTEVLQVNDGEMKVIYTCKFGEDCFPVWFHPDGQRIYMMTNQGDDVDLIRLILFNPETQKSELVHVDPEAEVDLEEAIFSEATDELLATVYLGDRQRIYPQTKDFANDLAFLHKSLPDGNLVLDWARQQEELSLVRLEQDVNPGVVYFFNRNTHKLEQLYESRPDLPSEHLAPMQAIRYSARDGEEIPAYLTIPQGVEARNLPVIIYPHGGPWARDAWRYDETVQFLANRGYAVVQPNFRGSTGYGKAFLNAGNKEWGRGVMQDDLTDGVRYLIEQGIADPERIGIFGASYGGYATLAGLAFTPELYAAGVSYVGPSNLITLIDALPPYWIPIQQMFLQRVGDPNDPAERERLIHQSPLFYADRIEAPLMIIHGAKDPRVKQAESDQIVVALRESGHDVEYLLAEDEGHGFEQQTNRLAVMADLERFLAQHLGGRYQKSIQPEIKERLETLRVDIKTVTKSQ